MCDSTYTIDRRTGEKLHCEFHTHRGNALLHNATLYQLTWFWTQAEADK